MQKKYCTLGIRIQDWSSIWMVKNHLIFTDPVLSKWYTNSRLIIQWGFEIWLFKIQKHLKSRLFEDKISNCLVFKGLGYSYGPNHSKTGPFENPDIFVPISNGFWQNGGHFSRFQMVGIPDFRFHSESRPFANQQFFGLICPDVLIGVF